MGQQSTRKESKMTLQHPSSILHCIKPHLEWSLSQAQCMYYESYLINDNTCTIVVSCLRTLTCFKVPKIFTTNLKETRNYEMRFLAFKEAL